MGVPEAPVHKYDSFAGWKYQIWCSRQALLVQPIPIPKSVQETAYDQFGLGIFASD
jgi:hypothetical protein